jgi:hypothetical protein
MKPYYTDSHESYSHCACGCGTVAAAGRKFVSGHNLKGLKRTEQHRARIGEGQRKAWATKRGRLPVGTKRHGRGGYVIVKVVAGHGRWEFEHTLVMEGILKRRLFPGEQVHHINGIKDDNSPENLHLCVTPREHSLLHGSFERLLGGLIEDGLVRFNRKRGIYERC